MLTAHFHVSDRRLPAIRGSGEGLQSVLKNTQQVRGLVNVRVCRQPVRKAGQDVEGRTEESKEVKKANKRSFAGIRFG